MESLFTFQSKFLFSRNKMFIFGRSCGMERNGFLTIILKPLPSDNKPPNKNYKNTNIKTIYPHNLQEKLLLNY